MVRDEKNYDQETWKQLRAKVRKFISIPEQFEPFLKERNLDMETFKLEECSDDE